MDNNGFEISHSGFATFKQENPDRKTHLYLDDFLNVDLFVTQFENGNVVIQPKGSSAKIEIYKNQIIITKKENI